MEWKAWQGKRIFVKLKSGAVYSGTVEEVSEEGDGLIFMSIIDKYNKWVTFAVSEIIKIVEEGE